MAWCPQCSSKVKAVKGKVKGKCPDCGSPLPSGPGFDQAVEYRGRDWFIVRTLTEPVQAENLKDFLETNGHDVAVMNGNGKTEFKLKKSSRGNHSMQILVEEDHAEIAARLIQSSEAWKRDTYHQMVSEDIFDKFDPDDEYINGDVSDYFGSTVGMDQCDWVEEPF